MDERGWTVNFKPQRVYDVLIAPVDASDSDKSYADIVLTGIKDEILVNSAISNLQSNQVVGFFPGNITISNSILVPYGVILQGVNSYDYAQFLIDTPHTPNMTMFVPLPSDGYYWLMLQNISGCAADSNFDYLSDVIPIKCTINNGDLVVLTNVFLTSNTTGIDLTGGGLTAYNLLLNGHSSSDVGSIGLKATNCDIIDWTGNGFNNNYIGYYETGIKINTATTIVHLNNVYFGTNHLVTPLNSIATNQVLDCNWGKTKVFKNRGVVNIAQGDTIIVVTHGLAFTPLLSQLQFIPDKSTNIFITNITSTQFTINIPASVTGGVNIGWSANLN
jgi:hypothetical protein